MLLKKKRRARGCLEWKTGAWVGGVNTTPAKVAAGRCEATCHVRHEAVDVAALPTRSQRHPGVDRKQEILTTS